jgi:hypothetical protein
MAPVSPRLQEDTLTELLIPTVVAVGCSKAFVEIVRRVTNRSGVLVEPEPLEGLSTIIARRKPLALLIHRDIYDFDPEEFDLLMRDVRGEVLVVEHEDMAFHALEQKLREALRGAERRRA